METKICEICGIEFPKPYTCSRKEWPKRKTCSRKCAHKRHSKIMKGHKSFNTKEGDKKASETMKRLYAEGKVEPWNKGKKGLQKWSEHQREVMSQFKGENSPTWKGDDAKHPTTFHQRARKHKKEMCERCGIQNTRLEVHHKDGNIKNNNPDNLATLCHRCHMVIDGRYESLKQRERDDKGKFKKEVEIKCEIPESSSEENIGRRPTQRSSSQSTGLTKSGTQE